MLLHNLSEINNSYTIITLLCYIYIQAAFIVIAVQDEAKLTLIILRSFLLDKLESAKRIHCSLACVCVWK